MWCVDEYEILNQAVEAGWGVALLDHFRHLQQHHPKFVLLFMGMRSATSLGREWRARFLGAHNIKVGFLAVDECRPLLESPVENFKLRYKEGALESLLHLTAGQPFLVQAVAYELVDFLNDEQRNLASVADVDRAAEATFDTREVYYENLWDDAETDGQETLLRIASGEKIAQSAVTKYLGEISVLTKRSRFAVPLIERWVRVSKL